MKGRGNFIFTIDERENKEIFCLEKSSNFIFDMPNIPLDLFLFNNRLMVFRFDFEWILSTYQFDCFHKFTSKCEFLSCLLHLISIINIINY